MFCFEFCSVLFTFPFPSLPFSFPSLPFTSLPFPFFPFPSLLFPSLPFPFFPLSFVSFGSLLLHPMCSFHFRFVSTRSVLSRSYPFRAVLFCSLLCCAVIGHLTCVKSAPACSASPPAILSHTLLFLAAIFASHSVFRFVKFWRASCSWWRNSRPSSTSSPAVTLTFSSRGFVSDIAIWTIKAIKTKLVDRFWAASELLPSTY